MSPFEHCSGPHDQLEVGDSLMADKDVGGTWESIGRRWSRDAEPPELKMLVYSYERDDSHDGVIYGPHGDVIRRVVDRAPKMGFKPGQHDHRPRAGKQ